MVESPPVHERPIAFAGPMVRALLAGRKTQTRRAITPQPARAAGNRKPPPCRYGVAGDRLWVRERFAYRASLDAFNAARDGKIVYAADDDAARHKDSRAWRQSRYMPRTASRILLEITACRAERLHRITRADALAEGFDPSGNLFDDPVAWFRDLWDQLNAGRAFAWRANPWVWVIKFRMLAPASLRTSRRARLNARSVPSD
jgi:hypothetical protein